MKDLNKKIQSTRQSRRQKEKEYIIIRNKINLLKIQETEARLNLERSKKQIEKILHNRKFLQKEDLNEKVWKENQIKKENDLKEKAIKLRKSMSPFRNESSTILNKSQMKNNEKKVIENKLSK